MMSCSTLFLFVCLLSLFLLNVKLFKKYLCFLLPFLCLFRLSLFLPQVFSLATCCLVTPGSQPETSLCLTTLFSVCGNPFWSYCTINYLFVANSNTEGEPWWGKELKQSERGGRTEETGLETVSIHISPLNFTLLILLLLIRHDCQTDSHAPDFSGPLTARSHSLFPTTLHIWWEFLHSPWHHTKGSPQKDGWGLQRYRCLWGTGLQPDCELKSHAETERLGILWCIQVSRLYTVLY